MRPSHQLDPPNGQRPVFRCHHVLTQAATTLCCHQMVTNANQTVPATKIRRMIRVPVMAHVQVGSLARKHRTSLTEIARVAIDAFADLSPEQQSALIRRDPIEHDQPPQPGPVARAASA